MNNFFKELVKSIEFSVIGGICKIHIDFSSTFNLLNLFSNKEEEEKKKAEEEAKKKEEEEEWEDDDWD